MAALHRLQQTRRTRHGCGVHQRTAESRPAIADGGAAYCTCTTLGRGGEVNVMPVDLPHMLRKTVLQGKFLQLYFACRLTNCTHLDPAKVAAEGCSTHSGRVSALCHVTHRTAMLNGTVVAFFDVSPLSPTAGLNPIDQRNGLLQAPAGTALVIRTCGQQQHSRAAATRNCVGMQHV